MKVNRFKEFLQKRYSIEYSITAISFENFLSNLNIKQWLNYGEWFGASLEKEALEKQIKMLKNMGRKNGKV